MRRLIDEASAVSAWAMDEPAIVRLFEIAHREHDFSPTALAAARGERLDGTERACVRDGVAVISIDGPLFKRDNLITALIRGTSYVSLMRDLRTAVDAPGVRAIMLAIDSPGGEAAGVAEFAAAVKAARGSKPIVAYVADVGASAAYWIASACDAIVCGPSAALGSIGVRMSIPDTRTRDERAGVRRFDFVSSQSPYKVNDPATEDGNARIQARVDALARVFVEAVADNRGVTVARVLEGFGRGDVLIGAAAVAAGMADAQGTFESVLADLGAGRSVRQPLRQPPAPRPRPVLSIAPTPKAPLTMSACPVVPRFVPASPVAPAPTQPKPSAAELAQIEGERAARAMLAAIRPPILTDAVEAVGSDDPTTATLLDAARRAVPVSHGGSPEEEAAVGLILEAYQTTESNTEAAGGDDGEAAVRAIMAAWRENVA